MEENGFERISEFEKKLSDILERASQALAGPAPIPPPVGTAPRISVSSRTSGAPNVPEPCEGADASGAPSVPGLRPGSDSGLAPQVPEQPSGEPSARYFPRRLLSAEKKVGSETDILFDNLRFLVDRLKQEKEDWLKNLKKEFDQSMQYEEQKRRMAESAVERLQSYAASLDGELLRANLQRTGFEQAGKESGLEVARLKSEIARILEFYRVEMSNQKKQWEERERKVREQIQVEVQLWSNALEEAQQGWEARESTLRQKEAEDLAAWQRKWFAREEQWLREQTGAQGKLEDLWKGRLARAQETIERLEASAGDQIFSMRKNLTEELGKEARDLRQALDRETKAGEDSTHRMESAVRQVGAFQAAHGEALRRSRMESAAKEKYLQDKTIHALLELRKVRTVGRAINSQMGALTEELKSRNQELEAVLEEKKRVEQVLRDSQNQVEALQGSEARVRQLQMDLDEAREKWESERQEWAAGKMALEIEIQDLQSRLEKSAELVRELGSGMKLPFYKRLWRRK